MVPTSLASAIAAAVLGMFQFGYNAGVINAPQRFIEHFIQTAYPDLPSDTVSFLFGVAVSACLVGGMVGGLAAGMVAGWLGRKRSIFYAQVFTLVGACLMGSCKSAGSYEMLVLGRLSIGLSCGLFTGLVPLYISEIAPVDIRGGVGTLNQLFCTLGILFSQIFGVEPLLGSETRWPLLLSLGGVIPAVIQLVALPFMPESPRYLILNKNDDEAGRRALQWLRADKDVDAEFDEIAQERRTDPDSSRAMSVLALLTSSRLRLAVALTVVIHLSQQLSGIVAVFYYSTKFFIEAGVSKEDAQYATIGVGAIMVSMTVVTIPLMDRLGRRTLHLSGLLGIILFSALITVALHLDKSYQFVNILLVLATFGFVVCFALGPGSIPWLITGELFTQSPRPAASSLATLVNWGGNLAVGLSFPALNAWLGNLTFMPYAVLTGLMFGLLFVFLPETKGRSVEEIAEVLQQPGAWKRKYGTAEMS